MKTLSLFVLVIVAVFATEDIFAEIRSSEFGATLTQTIELQLGSSSNINKVIKMVEKVKSSL